MPRTDQWSAINDTIIATLRSNLPVGPVLRTLRFEGLWEAHVKTGRGFGRIPKPPFHQFRKYGPDHMGKNYNDLWDELDIRACQLCRGLACDYERIWLDHYAFYPTGEIFTWVDPIFLSGNLHVDPRNPKLPPTAPLVQKWICKKCWLKRQDESYDLAANYSMRWERLAWSRLPDINLAQSPRVLRDRRVASHAYLEWIDRYDYTENFLLRTGDDRRHSSRRSTDVGPTWGEVLDARDQVSTSKAIRAA